MILGEQNFVVYKCGGPGLIGGQVALLVEPLSMYKCGRSGILFLSFYAWGLVQPYEMAN